MEGAEIEMALWRMEASTTCQGASEVEVKGRVFPNTRQEPVRSRQKPAELSKNVTKQSLPHYIDSVCLDEDEMTEALHVASGILTLPFQHVTEKHSFQSSIPIDRLVNIPTSYHV